MQKWLKTLRLLKGKIMVHKLLFLFNFSFQEEYFYDWREI